MKYLGFVGLLMSGAVGATTYSYVDDPVAGYNAKGSPTKKFSVAGALSPTVLDNVYAVLPESRVVNDAFIASSVESNIVIRDDFDGVANVKVTYLNEGAGFRNSFGYFVYKTANKPTTLAEVLDHKIIFPNASKAPEGEMVIGDTVDLDIELRKGDALGFFVVPNGWGWNGSGSAIQNDGPWGQPFYTIEDLNPEVAPVTKRHNVILTDTENQLYIIGFEDYKLPEADKDYNDLLIALDVTPFDSVKDPGIPTGGPSPKDKISNYPSLTGKATLLFEDLWPSQGDYDFNDVVLKYSMRRVLTPSDEMKQLDASYSVQANGAGYRNGFALHLPGVDKDNIKTLSLLNGSTPVAHEILETAASETVLIISPDIKLDLNSACTVYRSLLDCKESMDVTYNLSVTFETPIPESVTGLPPYDPFIFAVAGTEHGGYGNRGWEVHMKEFDGTSLFNSSYMGTADDRSSAFNSFVTLNNMPWVINVADEIDHPLEGEDIGFAYPKFINWVQSGGAADNQWYKAENAVSTKVYR